MTVPQLYKMVGDEVCNRWEHLGRMDSDIHWAYGREAEALIAEGVPAMLVYKAISIKAGKSSQTIRKSYNTYVAYTDAQRVKFEACPYSVFQIARTQPNKEAALQYYLDHRCSVDEVAVIFPEFDNAGMVGEFQSRGYDRIFYSVYREVYDLPPERKAQAEALIAELDRLIKSP